MPAPEAEVVPDIAPDMAPTREEPAVADALAPEPPTVLTAAVSESDEGPDTTEALPAESVPSSETHEPPTVPVTVPARAPSGIRYAGGAAPNAARPDYWDAEEASPYAGQVYPAHDEHADADGNGHDGNGHDGGRGEADDSVSDQSPARRQPPELDDDAPPFATAPFAAVPRLNRVRSMPAPPADDED
jgi:hypothetical protein